MVINLHINQLFISVGKHWVKVGVKIDGDALTGRLGAMIKWPIQSNGFGHEKNDVGSHVLGIGGVQWAIG